MADDRQVVRDAFLATVTEASAEVDPNPDGAEYDWHLELSVEATYVGSAPKKLVFDVWDHGGCGDFKGAALRTGDRIIVAAEDLRAEYQPADPFEGHMVLWRKTADGWSFFSDALVYGAEQQAYPKAARDATTKAEVLHVILSGALPATATDPAEPKPTPVGSMRFTALAFALGLVVALLRFRSRGDPRE
jgi:hypothetical protein